MAEGLKSYIARRREEGKPLQFSNVGPGNRPQSWDQGSGSTYFRPEQTWQKETDAELRKPASGFDYSEDVGQRFPTTPEQNMPQSRGSILNQALGELQKHIPGIVQHTLGGREAPTTDEEKQAVQQNIQAYLSMILEDIEKSAPSPPGKKEEEFEYYKGLSPQDKAAYEKIYGKKGTGNEGPSFADKEQYKYLVGRLKDLDGQLTGEWSEDLTDEERAKIQNERKVVLDGMMAIEDNMSGNGGMQRARGAGKESGQTGQTMDKRAAIQKAVDAGASKDDIMNFIQQNPQASVNDFLTHFGAGAVSKKKNDAVGLKVGTSNLDPRSEKEFQGWYKNYSDQLGLNPDPDHPEHYYDYREAFLQGAEPNEQGHWPSEFKREGHPRMNVDGMNTKTGEPAEVPDMKNTPVNKTEQSAESGQNGLQRKSVPYKTNPMAAPTEEQKEAAKQELVDLASKLGVGPEDWKAAGENYKALGKLAKEVGGWAWESYTNAIGVLLSGQEESKKGLPAYGGQF